MILRTLQITLVVSLFIRNQLGKLVWMAAAAARKASEVGWHRATQKIDSNIEQARQRAEAASVAHAALERQRDSDILVASRRFPLI